MDPHSSGDCYGKSVMSLLMIAFLLATGCASTRTHIVTRDEAGLSELQQRLGNSEISLYAFDRELRNVRMVAAWPDSIWIIGKAGPASLPTKEVYRIEDESSRLGFLWGALAGVFVGGAVGAAIRGGDDASMGGWADALATRALIGASVGLLAGGTIGYLVDKRDVYALEDQR